VLARSLESIGAGRGSSTGRSQSLPSGRGPFSGRSAEAVNLLVSGRPPRVGMVDLTPKQAEVVVLMASTVGLASPTSLHSLQVSPQAFAGRLAGAIDEHAVKPALAHGHLPGNQAPTLVGTTSTAAPTSSGPSRDASDPALLVDHPGRGSSGNALSASDAETQLCSRLPPEMVLRFSDIELVECISHGEFAVVHRGLLRSSHRDIVVKTLQRKDCLDDDQAAAELRAEICTIAELCHPRLVTFVGACLEPSCIALVTELAPGGNLHQALHVRRRQLARHERFQLATELLEGVRYLHTRTPPVAHLDLKSMNLVLDAEGRHLQICDFGLARTLGNVGDGCDRPPSRGGSPRYMAPECYDADLGAITEKADVWSSGCILIELFGGGLPYSECSNVQQILKIMLVHRSGPSIPQQIEASVRGIVSSMLAFDAPDRLAIAQVLLRLQAVATSTENKSRFLWIP